ncbi:hypothetical protein [Runella zeae]|uniref:hypothetical protein n=1 Tax=Runella zeae TaxID=94255 RepID=UPI000423E559|nr:hypothetical protein [Runella zeae]
MSSPYILQKQKAKQKTVKHERKPLTDEQRAEQRAKASCYLTVTFYDGNKWSKWSNEWKQPHKGKINEWINEMFRVCEEYFKGQIREAAIFDTRTLKQCIASERDPNCNKIYQYEKGSWRLVQPISW